MHKLLSGILMVFVSQAWAQPRTSVKESQLKKESSAAPNQDLAGDITRKKEESSKAAPALSYDEFRLGVELQVAEKRREQIKDLRKIIELSDKSPKEMPRLLFRLGELYWEESKHFFFEANRKDDDLIRALNAKDEAGQATAKAEKAELLEQSKGYAKRATDAYSDIVQRYKDFERTDEVLYFLGQNLMELGEDRKALVAYKRLIEKYEKSKFLPDAYLAFGEYYFNSSKGKRDALEKALEYYQKAAGTPESQVYAYALYKQGWCYFNMAEYFKAMDMYKAVVLYGEIAGVKSVEGEGRKGNRAGLIREARNDYVRAYARNGGSPTEARAEFAKLAKSNDDRFTMMKQLANLYYEDGKDKEAAVAFNSLIKEKPLSPEAPGFQGKIVDCVLRAGNKKMTVEQVRRLVKIMDDVRKSNTIRDEKDKKALEEAKDLSERTVSNLAVNWHKEAIKTRNDETFGYANEVYSDYLTLFPENKKAYEMRFFWAELLNDNLARYDKAAEEYTKIFVQDIERAKQEAAGAKDSQGAEIKPGKFMAKAGFNAVYSYDLWVKDLTEKGTLKPPVVGDTAKKVEMAPPRKSLLEACDRYVNQLPNGEKRVEIAFKAAKLFYDHNHLEEAVKRFSDIALNYPDYKFENGDRAGEVAANLVVDSFVLAKDWIKVNEWARKFYENEALSRGDFREELKKIIENSAFKLVSQYELNSNFAQAAEAYLNFVTEFPKSGIADQALFNAAIDFFKARKLDRAIEMRIRIINDYPKSKFVPQTLFDLAESYEATAHFDKAVDYYEAYAKGYMKTVGATAKGSKHSKNRDKNKASSNDRAATAKEEPSETGWQESKAQLALYNAGLFRDGLGQYRQALMNRERYVEYWPKAPDAEAVFLSIADLHERYGSYGKAIKQLEAFEKEYGQDPSKMLMAEGRMARLYETKLRSPSNARRLNERILKYHDDLRGARAKKLDPTALEAVARAHLASNEDEFRKFKAMKLRWKSLDKLAEFKTSIQEKARALENVQKIYTKTVGYKAADPAICALGRIGEAYDHFVQALLNPPIPRGMQEELLFEFKAQMEQQAQPVKEKAAQAFTAAVQKSQELDVFNECTVKALGQLREVYRPEQFPKMQEEVVAINVEQLTQVIGEGLLKEIQPLPVAGSLAEESRPSDKKRVDEDLPPPNETEENKIVPAQGKRSKAKRELVDEPN